MLHSLTSGKYVDFPAFRTAFREYLGDKLLEHKKLWQCFKLLKSYFQNPEISLTFSKVTKHAAHFLLQQ